jgi:hypothetical protein
MPSCSRTPPIWCAASPAKCLAAAKSGGDQTLSDADVGHGSVKYSARRASGHSLLLEVICVRQVSERGARYFADRCRRLPNDIGDLRIRARALRVQSPDCDELDFAAAEGPPNKPCFWFAYVAVFFFASWTKGWETWECDEFPRARTSFERITADAHLIDLGLAQGVEDLAVEQLTPI